MKSSAKKSPSSTSARWTGTSRDGVSWQLLQGDAKALLAGHPSKSVECIVTSPPYYWQRDYGVDGQIGNEKTIAEYVKHVSDYMKEAKRVLTDDGTLFLNLGDTYYSGKGEPKGKDQKSKKRRFGLRAVDASGLGVPPKTTIGIPWRVALQMISDGWTLRSPIIWERRDCLPEPSAKDRPWRTYEFVFLFSKSRRYYFNRGGLQGQEDVWRISARPRQNGLSTAAFPDQLVKRCIEVGCPERGRVLDPFAGSGTTVRVAIELGRSATGFDLNAAFCEYAAQALSRL